MSVQRYKRISEEIKKVVSNLIMFEMKDPRISKLTSVTHVDTTNDLRYTNIYISVYDPKASVEDTIKALKSAKGFIRSEISKELKLRHTPEPIFKADKSIENGMHINSLITKVNKDSKKEEEEVDEEFDWDAEDNFDEE